MLASEETETGENEWIQPSYYDQPDSDDEGLRPPEDLNRISRRHSSVDMPIKSGATHIVNPKDKKHMETLLVEKDDSDQALQTFLATDSTDDAQIWIQPGSTADEVDDPEVEPTSLLHDFKETITETLHHLHLSHASHPKPEIKEHGLLETAMETMLMERSSMLGAQPFAKVDEHTETKKLEDKRNASVESFKRLLAAPFRRKSSDSIDSPKHPKKEKFGLFDSAMKTMLIETAHIIEGVGVHPQSLDEDDGPAIERGASVAEVKENVCFVQLEECGELGEKGKNNDSTPDAEEGVDQRTARKEPPQNTGEDQTQLTENEVDQKTDQQTEPSPQEHLQAPQAPDEANQVEKQPVEVPETPPPPTSTGSLLKRMSSIDSVRKLLIAPFRRRSNESIDSPKSTKKDKSSPFDSAMKTMLAETAHIVEGVGAHPKSLDPNERLPDGAQNAGRLAETATQAPSTASQMPATSPPMPASSPLPCTEIDQSLHTIACEPECANPFASDGGLYNPTLTVTESPTLPANGNGRFNDTPVLVLTEDHSIPAKDHSPPVHPHRAHSVPKHLLPVQSGDRAPSANLRRSPKPKRKTNLFVNTNYPSINSSNSNNQHHSKTLIPCKSGSLINLTNRPNLDAPPHPTRSHDDKTSASGKHHHHHHHHHSHRHDSVESKSSPTKVHTSSSSYNTSAKKEMPAADDKDGKDKDSLCRRSSDSDLSVTPKGKWTDV